MDIEEDFELQYGIAALRDEQFLADAGILDEGEVSVHFSLDGGKRKRKKKVHTTPKRIPHKHKARSKHSSTTSLSMMPPTRSRD